MSGHSKSRGPRRPVEHDEHEEHVNHEAWVIPYADLLTLLMAMFVALFAMSTVDRDKFEAVAESFRRELGGDSPLELEGGSAVSPLPGAGSVLDGAGPAPVRSDLPGGPVPTSTPQTATIGPPEVHVASGLEVQGDLPPATFEVIPEADQVMGDPLTEVEQVIATRVAGTGMAGALGFRREARGLVVTIVTDQVLFAESSSTIEADGLEVLNVIGEALGDVPNAVIVEGHTDSRPISSGRFPSNWELSTARAISVLRHLTGQGFPVERISAGGYADTRPIDPAGTPEAMARNRRVEIVVLSTAVAPPDSPPDANGG